MKKYSLFLLIGCFIIFQSCQTSKVDFPIPGENQIRMKNIYTEYMNIADEYFKLENYSKAVTYYKYAMNNKELYWTAFYKLARTYVCQEDWNNALSFYKIIYERDKDNATILSSMAYLYAMTSDFENAKTIYKQLIEENPDVDAYLENYISILLLNGELEESVERFEVFTQKFPDNKNIEKMESAIKALKKEKGIEDTPEKQESEN